MRNRVISLAAAAGILALSLSSCNGGKAKVTGRFIGLESQKVSLEYLSPEGGSVVDSTMTDNNGNYKLKATLPQSGITLYNLVVGEESIPLFLAPGDKVNVNSLYGMARNYSVDGSEESLMVKQINDILYDGSSRLDSILTAHPMNEASDEERYQTILDYTKEYQRIKREQIGFIVTNSSSLAAIYALYQRLPGDEILFNGDSDIIYYRLVADSVSGRYPDSPYLAALKSGIAEYDAGQEWARRLNNSLENPIPFPDITLPDIYNVRRQLSSNIGKVILLDFWSAAESTSAVVNAEYKELYDLYASRGLEIYQVNADTSRPLWVNAVLDQQLPWISVSDLRGASSPALLTYNIQQIPSNFLIDADGDIVGKNIYGDQLDKEVSRLVRNMRK